MKTEEIISSILQIVNSPIAPFNEDADWNIKNVVYTGDKIPGTSKTDLKNNPHFTITGKENVNSYESLYKELLKNVAKNKDISLKTFQDLTQNLIFENAFTIDNIEKALIGVSEHKTIEIFKIYGLKIQSDIFVKGRYTFIKKDKIYDFIDGNLPGINKETPTNKFSLSVLNGCLKEEDDFVFVAITSISYDDIQSFEKAEKEIALLISAMNFMYGFENVIVSLYPLSVKRIRKYQLNVSSRWINSSGEMFYGGVPFFIDIGANRLVWHDKIWEIISKSERNELQKRIVKAIEWASKAFIEDDENLKRVEIAFAFEALLQSNSSEMIKESILALLSEQYAFINGVDLEDRKNKEKDFKNFYRERSGIAHGGKTHYETNANKYLSMVTGTIFHILTDKCFADCKSGDDVYSVIKDMKYSSSMS